MIKFTTIGLDGTIRLLTEFRLLCMVMPTPVEILLSVSNAGSDIYIRASNGNKARIGKDGLTISAANSSGIRNMQELSIDFHQGLFTDAQMGTITTYLYQLLIHGETNVILPKLP